MAPVLQQFAPLVNWEAPDLGFAKDLAGHMQTDQKEQAMAAVKVCQSVLPGAAIADLDRIPLKDRLKMEEFRNCLRAAGLP